MTHLSTTLTHTCFTPCPAQASMLLHSAHIPSCRTYLFLHSCTVMPCLQEALNRGLLPDDNTLMQLSQEKDSIVHGRSLDTMRWPDSDLRAVLIRELQPSCSAHSALPCCSTHTTMSAVAGRLKLVLTMHLLLAVCWCLLVPTHQLLFASPHHSLVVVRLSPHAYMVLPNPTHS